MTIKLFGKTVTIRAETSALPPVKSDDAWSSYLAGAGAKVSAETALKVAAVFRCVDLVSKTMAALPLHLYRKTSGGREKAENHRLYDLLYVQPNKHTTAYELMQMYVANLLLTKGAYLKIKRDRNGFITELWNIPTGNVVDMDINAVNGERYIRVVSDGTQEILREGDFVYTPSFRFRDDSDPEDPVKIAADVLGLTRDMNKFAQKGFSGASPGGFIEHPNSLSDVAYERFKRDFQANYAGVENAGRWLFLEEGAKAAPWTRDMEKSQLLESRKWAVTEICRIFGVPPHLCMDMEHATFSNIEQQSLEFVRDCIRPNGTRIEQTLFKDLLTEREKKKYYFKFNLNGLLRGDTATRAQYYSVMRQGGIMTANEIRRLEELSDLPGDIGDIVFVNGNMLSLESAAKNVPKGAQNTGGAKRE